MTLALGPHRGHVTSSDLIAASLLTSATGAEVQLVVRDGRRLRLAADDATARELALTLWRALDASRDAVPRRPRRNPMARGGAASDGTRRRG